MELDKEKISLLAAQYNLALVILFGSHSREESTPMSDTDIAVLIDTNARDISYKLELAMLLDFQKVVNNGEVDLVLLNKATPFLKYQVATEGKLLFEKQNDLYVEFMTKAMKEYEDVRHFEKYYNEILDEFLGQQNDK